MTCAEFKDLVAAYAIGALEVSEREAMDAHLAGPGPHEGCQAAMTAAHEAASVVGRALSPVRLDERLWKSIEDKAGLAPSAARLDALGGGGGRLAGCALLRRRPEAALR
jgi:hypothetical protein